MNGVRFALQALYPGSCSTVVATVTGFRAEVQKTHGRQ